MELAPGPEPQLTMEAFRRRRERVADALQDDQVLIVATHEETTYSNDVHHRFRPHSDFWYLTGFAEPGAVLMLAGDGRADLWMRSRRPDAEVWDGRRLGLERAERLGIEHAHDVDDLAGLARRVGDRKVLARTDHHAAVHEVVANLGEHEDARDLLARFRMIKDRDEVRLLQQAADVGTAAMEAALPLCSPGRGEYEVEAALVQHYRGAGSTGPGYPPIVGRGPNAAVLHYIQNQDRIRAGDLVLVDAGCEWGYYNSDITRTVPADGRWDGVAGDVYAAVHAAQQAAMAKVRPGNRLKDPHQAAVDTLVDALVDMGHLTGDKEKIVEEQEHRAFFMHGTSHFLGLDVHDVGIYKEDGESVTLREGMCITVEPGLYYNPDFATCPEAAVGIGVRIENDLVVTADGHHDLTSSLAASPDAVLDLLGP